MVSYHVYVKTLEDDEIEVVDDLDINKEYIPTDRSFASEEIAKDWIKANSTSYIIRRI
jgi:hypothetical protein